MFINQLPGLTLERIDKIAEKEQINFVTVWNDVRERAWLRLEKDLRRRLRTSFKLKSIKSFATAKPTIDKITLVDGAAKYRGPVIDLGIRPGSFLCIGVDKISITLSAAATSLPIKLFDNDGVLLDTFTISNATEGKNEIEVNRKYFTTKIFIAVDSTLLPLYAGTLPGEVISKCCDIICDICGENCDPSIYGAEADLDDPGTVVSASNFFGFEVAYSIVCDYSAIICSNKTEFTDVWMFCLGTELMLENLFSTRLTRFTTIDKQGATDLKDFYTSEYEDALDETINALEMQEEDCCIVCNPLATYKESTP